MIQILNGQVTSMEEKLEQMKTKKQDRIEQMPPARVSLRARQNSVRTAISEGGKNGKGASKGKQFRALNSQSTTNKNSQKPKRTISSPDNYFPLMPYRLPTLKIHTHLTTSLMWQTCSCSAPEMITVVSEAVLDQL